MSGKEIEIPKHGGAGVAFAGVELKDCFFLFGGVLAGFISGSFLGLGIKGYVLVPAAFYFLNVWYLDWKEGAPPGHLRAILYRFGILGYSQSFPTANMVYVGDSLALNPASQELASHVATRLNEGGR